jgi:hypothetical protein
MIDSRYQREYLSLSLHPFNSQSIFVFLKIRIIVENVWANDILREKIREVCFSAAYHMSVERGCLFGDSKGWHALITTPYPLDPFFLSSAFLFASALNSKQK